MIYAPGSTSQSIDVQVLDDSGLPVTALAAAGFPAVSWSRGGNTAATTITLSDLAAITSAYSAGGVKERSGGWYRLDLPDAALAAAGEVNLIAEASGKHLVHRPIFVLTVPANVTQSLGVAVTNEDGTLAGATSTTVTFPATDSAGAAVPDAQQYQWAEVQVVGGTGKGQVLRLTTATGTARQYNVDPGSMPTQCDGTSKYVALGVWRANVSRWADVQAVAGAVPAAAAGAAGGLWVLGANAAAATTLTGTAGNPGLLVNAGSGANTAALSLLGGVGLAAVGSASDGAQFTSLASTGHGLKLARGGASGDDLFLTNSDAPTLGAAVRDADNAAPAAGSLGAGVKAAADRMPGAGTLAVAGAAMALTAGSVNSTSIADDAITDAKIAVPPEASGRPSRVLAMVRRLWEGRHNKRVRDRSTGVLRLRNTADNGDLETATQSTSGSADTQTAGA